MFVAGRNVVGFSKAFCALMCASWALGYRGRRGGNVEKAFGWFLVLHLHFHSEGGGGSCSVYGFAFDDFR